MVSGEITQRGHSGVSDHRVGSAGAGGKSTFPVELPTLRTPARCLFVR